MKIGAMASGGWITFDTQVGKLYLPFKVHQNARVNEIQPINGASK